MKVYVLIEINKGDPYQWQTRVLSAWMNEDNAKAEAKKLHDANQDEYPGCTDAFEVQEFDLSDVDPDNFYAFTVGT